MNTIIRVGGADIASSGFGVARHGRTTIIAALLLGAASGAYAQDAAPAAPAAQAAADEAAEEQITVTGSRITRSGFDQPTPVTVIDQAAIQAGAEPNLADFVNRIPSVVGSVTPANTQRNLSGGTAGLNTINLRNLGSNRTLILLDGRRSVASAINGTVDINTIPQGLVKSVEVVTGGASSVYGSDAVAGIVNFILDKKFTGLKGEATYGETTYGDDATYRLSLSAGMKFAGGRGHVLLSGDFLDRAGVLGAPRPWASRAMHLIQNPAYVKGNGQPELLASERTGLNTLTAGGIITRPSSSQNQASLAFLGTYFGPGGTINRYNFGENRLNNSPWTLGGDYLQSQHFDQTSLQPGENVKSIFGRVSFEVTNDFEVFAEATYNQSKATNVGGYFTSKGNITVNTRNPFIPEPLRTQMIAAGIGDFTIGSWDADLPGRQSNNDRRVQRYVAGFTGRFEALGSDWGIDGYYQHGVSDVRIQLNEIINRTKLGYARDAVRDGSGNIVCRSTAARLADPLFAGCLPYNSFGTGVNSQAVINYIIGDPYTDQKYTQDVAAVNFSTSIENGLIDPIGIAFGVEHRREAVSGFVEDQYRAGWVVGNFEASRGSFNVTEAYLETLFTLPLGFEFSGAARYTDYSQSGTVVTWKTGLTWQPISDLRLRFTRSRDIRAPNLGELFQAGSRNTNSVSDPWQTGRPAVRYTQTVTGNLDLDPEKADTLGLGVVYRPSYLPGFGLSVDYYDIKINGAIGNVTPQQIMDRCFDGTNPQLCQRLQAIINQGASNQQTIAFGQPGFTQANGAPGVNEYLIANSPFNFLSERARGLDFEVSYRFDLDAMFKNAPGNIALRAVATRFLENSTDNGVEAKIDTVGQNTFGGPPKWTFRATLDYTIPDTFNFQLVGRGLSSGVYSNDFTQCTSSCPFDPTDERFRTIQNNRIPGDFYVDTFVSYTLPFERWKPQLFLQVRNLFNEDPVPVGKGPSDTSNPDTGINQTLYDYLGRTFRIGLRFNFGG
ncbi:TonB-dependent receptor plug domain-containing protein [Sandarakinorhabdus rubra]|uniref:TonB-dependent receptor plug domain-containing protein n=1 Tax=Sandarakinorhabdus rubra TaxID=2672568 RepID=UPI0013DD5B0A|nr:TonB-dependent receptor [Sandarakinorhabdus rubra]